MQRQRLFELRGDVFGRVERIARVLQHHRNAVAAKALPAAIIQGQQIVAQHVKLPGTDHAGLAHQPHQRPGRHGFTGAGFAH
ncbi:hypothetical protein D3C71_1743900 [compost metagenome]